MDDRTKKERNIDKLVTYLKANPNATYAQAAKAMHKSHRTIYNWCKELGIKLATASAAIRPSPSYDFTAPRTSFTPRAQSQSYSSMGDVGKIIDTLDKVEAFKDRVRKQVEDSKPPAESLAVYEARLNFESERAHQQTKDEMLKSVILPLGDYFAQLLIKFLGGDSKRQ